MLIINDLAIICADLRNIIYVCCMEATKHIEFSSVADARAFLLTLKPGKHDFNVMKELHRTLLRNAIYDLEKVCENWARYNIGYVPQVWIMVQKPFHPSFVLESGRFNKSALSYAIDRIVSHSDVFEFDIPETITPHTLRVYVAGKGVSLSINGNKATICAKIEQRSVLVANVREGIQSAGEGEEFVMEIDRAQENYTRSLISRLSKSMGIRVKTTVKPLDSMSCDVVIMPYTGSKKPAWYNAAIKGAKADSEQGKKLYFELREIFWPKMGDVDQAN